MEYEEMGDYEFIEMLKKELNRRVEEWGYFDMADDNGTEKSQIAAMKLIFDYSY